MKKWKKGIASWQVNNVLYLSVPFTWLVNDAISIANKFKGKVIVGGPGATLLKDKFNGIAEYRGSAIPFEPVVYHNPFATFTTRGCINKCPFCAVPIIEGKFREIPDFIPRPIVCDNNFLASSKKHFNRVIDKLKPFPFVDFNQGLEAKLFTSEIADRFCELKRLRLRFAFDKLSDEKYVVDAINLARKKGLSDIRCYVLYGFKDTPKEALHKVEILRDLKVDIFPMGYIPLDSMDKKVAVNEDKDWTDYEIKRFRVYWFLKGISRKIPFDEWDMKEDQPKGFGFIPSIKDGREERWGKCKNYKEDESK